MILFAVLSSVPLHEFRNNHINIIFSSSLACYVTGRHVVSYKLHINCSVTSSVIAFL